MKSIAFLVALVILGGCASANTQSLIKNRQELAQSYLESHVEGDLKSSANIYQALQNVFSNLPDDVFNEIIHYKRPIIFIGSYTTTIARFARSHQFLVTPDDPKKTLSDGIYIITLADELNNSSVEAIEGVIYHEIAHRYLEHLLKPVLSCEMEREANRLVKQWGFEKQYLEASKTFGAKYPGDSRCRDEEQSVN